MMFYRRLLETAFLTVRNNQNQLGKPEGGDEEGLTELRAGGWLLVARSAEVTHNSESGDRSASGDGPGKSNKQHDRANYGRAYHRAGPYHLFTRQTKLCEQAFPRHMTRARPLSSLLSCETHSWSLSELNNCCKWSICWSSNNNTIV